MNEKNIRIDDIKAVMLLNKTLNLLSCNRAIGDRVFDTSDLAKIEKLKLEKERYQDISFIQYCPNLKILEISSISPKDLLEVSVGIRAQESMKSPEYKYFAETNDIKDFSPIEKLENLEELTIRNDLNIKEIDLSNLKNLQLLNLSHNKELTDIKGLECLNKLDGITLLNNNVEHSFDIKTLYEKGMLSKCKLDVCMYPYFKEEYPDISELESWASSRGLDLKWIENYSDISSNMFSTGQVSEIDRKVEKILNENILSSQTDAEKVMSIYLYLCNNIKYDYDGLNKRKEKEKDNKALNEFDKRINSGYNAIVKSSAICEGYTNAMRYMLKCAGIDSQVVSCSNKEKTEKENYSIFGSTNHSAIKVKIENDTYYFDPTWDAASGYLDNCFKTKDEFKENHFLQITENKIPSAKPYEFSKLKSLRDKVLLDIRNIKDSRFNPVLKYQIYGMAGFAKVYCLRRSPIVKSKNKEQICL